MSKTHDANQIDNIEIKRTGGQVALRGFNYQIVYSCYITLKFLDDINKSIRFEGIEDVDLFKTTISDNQDVNHIQLKYSGGKEDASFFNSILKNYLEVYLNDKTRNFTLVYDAEIAKGNLEKLIKNKLDDKTIVFWQNKIDKIKKENANWNWSTFNFHEFYNKLNFENLKLDEVIRQIDSLIIERFNIILNNESIFRNALFYNIFHMAKERKKITLLDLESMIQNTKDDISKGSVNPAYKWIDKIDFDLMTSNTDSQYFEGKKATPADIASKLPIRRKHLESEIIESVLTNQVTIIKSSSGQGKSTLAWQVAHELNENYSIYKIKWCKETEEINFIIDYFNSRLKLGEKILIIIDNLDDDVKCWNKLSQGLSEKISINYSILITTREEDWYRLSGDQSNIGSLCIKDIFLDSDQAGEIYNNLNSRNKVHASIRNWQNAWERVEKRGVLIEYIYLLTHGEMLEDRINHQIKVINNDKNGLIKLEILRIISLADTIGIKIKGNKLFDLLRETYPSVELNEIIKSIANEYFIGIDNSFEYIEGLHPVRSQHIVDNLHKYHSIDDTLIKLFKVIDDLYASKLYSKIPLYIEDDKDKFYDYLAKQDSEKSYKYLTDAIKGLFSGSIYKYFLDNKSYFDDANNAFGLKLFVFEINPWNSSEYNSEVKTIFGMYKINPGNENLKKLLELVNGIDLHTIEKSDYYIYTYYLFKYLYKNELKRDKSYFVELANWLRRINKKFDIVSNLNLRLIWENKEEWKFDDLGKLMYLFCLLSRDKYLDFVSKFKSEIFTYLRIHTNTPIIFEKDKVIYIRYILLPDEISNDNDESVNRISRVCEFLPIYEYYHSDSIKPDIELFRGIKYPDNSHKEMQFKNVVLPFNADLYELWNQSILSQFELSSIYEWQKHWIDVRYNIIKFLKLNIEVLEKLLKQQKISNNLIENINCILGSIIKSLCCVSLFPLEERPFENNVKIDKPTNKLLNYYFFSLKNYLNQFQNIILKKTNDNSCNLAMFNLREAKIQLNDMQIIYNDICCKTEKYFSTKEIESEEDLWISRLIYINEYYMENNPSKYFSRNDVRKFREDKSKKLLKEYYKIIDNVSEIGFSITKPNKILDIEKFNVLTICVRNIDINDEVKLVELILALAEFAKTELDYIFIIFIDEDGKVLPNGLRCNVMYLGELLQSVEYNKDIEEDNISHILPFEISEELLECFDEEIFLKVIDEIEKKEKECIGSFLISLWEYNVYRHFINELYNNETEWIKSILSKIESKVVQYLDEITECKRSEILEILISLKKNILNDGAEFNDDNLNQWINKLLLNK
nr:hypothetical protein [Clostridioides sp.]